MSLQIKIKVHFQLNIKLLQKKKTIGCFCMTRSFQAAAVPAGNYRFKVNNRNTKTMCEICSKLTLKTLAVGLFKCV